MAEVIPLLGRASLWVSLLAVAAAWAGAPTPARGADAGCGGPAVQPGAVLHGPVLQIPDNATLCIAKAPSPTAWVAVRLSTAGVSRRALMAAAFGKNATCAIGPDGRGTCLIEGKPLTQALTRPNIDASAWR